MIRVLSASKDCYITNKIINNRFRATDANVGQAGTLDLFKLYNESSLPTEAKPFENSRILLKFDLTDIERMHEQGKLNVGSNSFKSYVKLHDVYGGQTTPSNFNVIIFPLAKDFDEGQGFDIVNFKDLGATNWITSSYTAGTLTEWTIPGANKSGSLGESGIDVIVSGTLPGQIDPIPLCSEQLFVSGDEDLKIDVTSFVSASVKSLVANKGFLVAYSGSYEKDNNSYFVKRFASRNTANTALRPKLIVEYDDSIIDNHGNFIFDYTGSLYLNNFSRTGPSNIKNADNTDVAVENAMILKIRSGSFQKNFSVSQALNGNNRITGLYSSSFALSSYDNKISNALKVNDEIEFKEIWSSADESVTFLSSSFKVKKNKRTSFEFSERRLFVKTLNLNDRYQASDNVRIRLFIENADREVVFTKGPVEKSSEIFEHVHFSVKDAITGKIIIPFNTSNDSTKLSADSNGMYYDFYMSSLPRGRAYIFEYLVVQGNTNTYITDAASKFVVE
jgi:hypothetical protein